MAKAEHADVKKSIRELTRIYKPKLARKFVEDFVRKYKITKGYETELEQIVLDELRNIQTRDTESRQI